MPEISANETKASASAAIRGRRIGARAALVGAATKGAAAGGSLATIVKPAHHMGSSGPWRKDDQSIGHPADGLCPLVEAPLATRFQSNGTASVPFDWQPR